jgi:hypothetical protein
MVGGVNFQTGPHVRKPFAFSPRSIPLPPSSINQLPLLFFLVFHTVSDIFKMADEVYDGAIGIDLGKLKIPQLLARVLDTQSDIFLVAG